MRLVNALHLLAFVAFVLGTVYGLWAVGTAAYGTSVATAIEVMVAAWCLGLVSLLLADRVR